MDVPGWHADNASWYSFFREMYRGSVRCAAAPYLKLVWDIIRPGRFLQPFQHRFGNNDPPAVRIAYRYGWSLSHLDSRIFLFYTRMVACNGDIGSQSNVGIQPESACLCSLQSHFFLDSEYGIHSGFYILHL